MKNTNNSEAKEQQSKNCILFVTITVSPISLSDTFLTVANNSYSRKAVFIEKNVTLLINSLFDIKKMRS